MPIELVQAINLIGDRQLVKERLRAYRDAGVTTFRAEPRGDAQAERLDTLGQLMNIVRELKGEMPARA